MKKEPIALYIFRFILGFGLFAFMCMLYWSSVLIEEDMKGLKQELSQLNKSVASLKGQVSLPVQKIVVEEQKSAVKRPHIDDHYPNILITDPFFAETLPKLLGPNFTPQGTLRVGTLGRPANLHPFSGWHGVNVWLRLCGGGVGLNQFGKYEAPSPYFAIKMEMRPNEKTKVPEFWVHLRDDIYWQPLNPDFFSEDFRLAPQFLQKTPVTAEDFKFYIDALLNPHLQQPGAVALRTYYADIDEIEVVDPLTFIVRWKSQLIGDEQVPKIKYAAKYLMDGIKPLASFVYKYYADGTKIVEDDQNTDVYRTDSVFAQQFSEHWAKNVIVSCGPMIFDGMTDKAITFKRNPDFFEPQQALVEGRTDHFKDTAEAIWLGFKAGQSDLYTLQPHQHIELDDFLASPEYKAQEEKGNGISRVDFTSDSYTYVGWNMTTPYFSDRRVRQAMTMAIDRERIIRQNLNGMGVEVTGTFFVNSPSYNHNIEPWPFDPAGARLLLEEAGWYDSDGDGIIDKEIGGKRMPFRFSLTYYVKNATTKSVCEYIATALKEIGVVCELNGVDVADLSNIFDEKSFDAYMLAWSFGNPPENPRQLWYSTGAKQKGSSNAVGFVNTEADKIIDRLEFEDDYNVRLKLYHRFSEILHEEQPYTFLFTQKVAQLFRDRVQNVFIPAERQDLIPGAVVEEPQSKVFWLKE